MKFRYEVQLGSADASDVLFEVDMLGKHDFKHRTFCAERCCMYGKVLLL